MARRNTSNFQTEVKKYDTIRKVLSQMYLYGCQSQNELIESNLIGENVSPKAMGDYLQRIHNYLDSGQLTDGHFFQTHNVDNRKTDKKRYKFIRDPFVHTYNFLASTFRQHTILTADILFYCYLLEFNPQKEDLAGKPPYTFLEDFDSGNEDLQGLLDDEANVFLGESAAPFYAHKGFTANELFSFIDDVYSYNGEFIAAISQCESKDFEVRDHFTPQTCQNKINELVDLGILIQRDNRYHLVDDIFTPNGISLDEDVLRKIREMLQFFSNYSFLSVPGYFLQDKAYMALVAASREKTYLPKQSDVPFYYENPRHENLIHDEIMWELLNHIHRQDVISFTYQASTADKTSTQNVLPIKIVIDHQWGRPYVFAYSYTGKQPRFFRIDRIYEVETISHDYNKYRFLPSEQRPTDGAVANYAALDHYYHGFADKAWSVSISTNSEALKKVVLHFHFDDSNRARIRKDELSLYSQKGALIKIDDFNYDFTCEIYDPIEMIPWINSFGEFVIVDTTSDVNFYNELQKKAREALDLYESIS